MDANEADAMVGATRTSFAIIEALRELDAPTLSEVATATDIPTATVHNHLETLQALGYVIREGDTYALAVRFLGIGEAARRERALFDVGRPEIERLAEETDERVNLMVEEHGRGVHLDMAIGGRGVELDTYPGFWSPLHATSLGKSILAHLPEERLEEIIDRHGLPSITDNTITDRERLDDRLERIRQRGYAIDDEERIEGWRCVGAPILAEDTAVGAVSIAGPVTRLRGERWTEELPRAVENTANVIEVHLSVN